MWVAKIKISSKKTLIGDLAQKHNIDVAGYPISFHKKGNKILSFLVGEMFGEDKSKKAFIKSLKKEKRVAHMEVKNNFLSALFHEPLKLSIFYNPNILYIKSLFISKEGWQLYNIASWDRKELTNFLYFLEKNRKGKILKLKKEKISNISIMTSFPEMTKKQKQALDLAIKEGYYEYPRKTDVQTLAKKQGLAFSTFQAHLRKAEKKVIVYSNK